ncbi:hypothetical protein JW935_10250 [candidate division KSB1 bacterium]|nr:hypothetical protein [candidate division KSB1 bacterium]
MPFYFGFQGNGLTLKVAFNRIKSIAKDNHLKTFSFITGNDCMQNKEYKWTAGHFDRVCLSLDGDERLHDLQRRTQKEKGTYARVVKTINLGKIIKILWSA